NGWTKILPREYGCTWLYVKLNVPAFAILALGICRSPTVPQSLAVTTVLRERGAGVRAGSSLVSRPVESSAGPWVARNRISLSEKISGHPEPRVGAQIHAPGAGSSCASRFHVAIPNLCTRPSGWAIHAQSTRRSASGLHVSTYASASCPYRCAAVHRSPFSWTTVTVRGRSGNTTV